MFESSSTKNRLSKRKTRHFTIETKQNSIFHSQLGHMYVHMYFLKGYKIYSVLFHLKPYRFFFSISS